MPSISSRLLGGIATAAAAALMAIPVPASAAPAVTFGFGFDTGPGGPSIHFGINEPPPAVSHVCFYSRSRYRGDRFCVEADTYIRDLGDTWADEISSFENPDGLRVTVCTRTRLHGDCRIYTGNARTLGDFDDDIESLRVRDY